MSTISPSGTEHLSCAETATLVRGALKQAFPSVKFSVRSKTYSGGASINVEWTDGPKPSDVERITNLYTGASFDGMIDLKSYHDSILVDESGNPRVVSFGSDYIFTRRNVSEEWELEIYAEFSRVLGREIQSPRLTGNWDDPSVPLAIDRDGTLLHMVDSETEYVNTVFHRYTTLRSREEA